MKHLLMIALFLVSTTAFAKKNPHKVTASTETNVEASKSNGRKLASVSGKKAKHGKKVKKAKHAKKRKS